MNTILLVCILALCGGISARANERQDTIQYEEKKVTFRNADSLHFGATITLPLDVKKPPVVIFVSGTGPQNRDGEMAGHKMFADIAHFLGAHGVASLRVDDRGVGGTNGTYETATTEDFANDVLTAVHYLKGNKNFRLGKIGLIGHSEGGAAATIAASRTHDVSFLITLAGLMTDGFSSLFYQNESLVDAAPIPDYDKKRSNEINRLMFTTAYRYADSDSLESKLNQVYNEWKPKDDAYFKSLNVGEYDHFRFPIYMYTQQAKGVWYRFFIRYNPAPYLRKIRIPVLALNGDRDLMVSYKENFANLKRNLPHHGKRLKTVMVPGVNHLFLPCEKGTPDEYSKINAPFSAEALRLMLDWINRYGR